MSATFTHETTLFAEPIFSIGSFSVTNSLLTSWIAVLLIVVFSVVLRKKLKQIPGFLQNIMEMIVEQGLALADLVTNDRKISLKIFPVAITIFVFVLINNWIGFFPGVGSIGFVEYHEGHNVFVPLLRGGTADINTTLALSLIAVVGANIFGIVSIGLWNVFNKYVNIKILASIPSKVIKDPMILVTAPIHFFVGVFEIIGELAKIASLSFRLFGNIFAGEVLLMSMSMIMAYGVPIPFLFLEIFVGVIQALIFSLLTIVYFTIASTSHDHEEEHSTAH
ncbi:F0F1 ATP synthase subunit A [Patescibacteria group bacterium]|nr:F0F1 ATP synthase subunit A [Patescibacteria group bacterium]